MTLKRKRHSEKKPKKAEPEPVPQAPEPGQTSNPRQVTWTNVALSSNGGMATASSHQDFMEPSIAIDGNRVPQGGSYGWVDNTPDVWPDWLRVDFSGMQTIEIIQVISLQDAWDNPSPVTSDMTFTLYGLIDFEVQYWTGSDATSGEWVTLGSATGNNLVLWPVVFAPVTTYAIRIMVNAAAASLSRVVEFEVYRSSAHVFGMWNSPTLPPATQGQPYQQRFVTVNGTGPFTWSVVDALPAGLSLTTNGILSGTPLAEGPTNFTLTVTDSLSASSTRPFSLQIARAPATEITWITSTSVSSPDTQSQSTQAFISNTAALAPNVMIAVIGSSTAQQNVQDAQGNTWTTLAGSYTNSSISQIWWIAQGTLNLTSATHQFNVFGAGAAPSLVILLLRSSVIPIPVVDLMANFLVIPGGATTKAAGRVSGGAITLTGVSHSPGLITSVDSEFTVAQQRPGVSGQAFGLSVAYKIAPGPTDPTWTLNTLTNPIAVNLSLGFAPAPPPPPPPPGGGSGPSVGIGAAMTTDMVVGSTIIAHRR